MEISFAAVVNKILSCIRRSFRNHTTTNFFLNKEEEEDEEEDMEAIDDDDVDVKNDIENKIEIVNTTMN